MKWRPYRPGMEVLRLPCRARLSPSRSWRGRVAGPAPSQPRCHRIGSPVPPGKMPPTKGKTAGMSATIRNANGLKRSSHGLVTQLRAADTLVIRRESGFLTADAIVRPQIPGRSLALLAAAAGLAKKAENVAVLDV